MKFETVDLFKVHGTIDDFPVIFVTFFVPDQLCCMNREMTT